MTGIDYGMTKDGGLVLELFTANKELALVFPESTSARPYYRTKPPTGRWGESGIVGSTKQLCELLEWLTEVV